MNDLELKLPTLLPAKQPELTRRILAVSHRKRQRRRDCFVGLGGLLTGIAATLLLVVFLPGTVPQWHNANAPPPVEEHFAQQNDGVVASVATLEPDHPAATQHPSKGGELDSPNIDMLLARYEKLLRNRPAAYKPVVYISNALPEGVNPLEYRNRLLSELQPEDCGT
jgi:hypothetical protein